MKKQLIFIAITGILFSCNSKKNTSPAPLPDTLIADHPDWILQGNIYEVNTRQYTASGKFADFATHLNRLKDMGVQTLWFMPINPISKKDRKGSLGSYYAIADYTAINPEYGNMEDWKKLVAQIHEQGMKVIIDWVPNHTGADHPWLDKHPDFFIKDSTGKPATMFDWTDTRVLDFNNREMQDSMIAAMKFWLTETGIDGFRVDVAWNVPGDFWKKCIPELKAVKQDLFMLAEGDKPYLMTSGFNAYYPWEMFHMMVKVAAGERPAFALDSIKAKYDTVYPKKAIPMYFTSNHDENSWNKSDYGTFPGTVHAPFAVFTQTMSNTVPLLYSGQEEPVLRPLPFFEKDSIVFSKLERAGFYKKLQELRKNNPALAADASFKKVNAGDDKAVYAFAREKAGKKILVILNLSKKEQAIQLNDAEWKQEALNVFSGTRENPGEKAWKMQPWGYAVYAY